MLPRNMLRYAPRDPVDAYVRHAFNPRFDHPSSPLSNRPPIPNIHTSRPISRLIFRRRGETLSRALHIEFEQPPIRQILGQSSVSILLTEEELLIRFASLGSSRLFPRPVRGVCIREISSALESDKQLAEMIGGARSSEIGVQTGRTFISRARRRGAVEGEGREEEGR